MVNDSTGIDNTKYLNPNVLIQKRYHADGSASAGYDPIQKWGRVKQLIGIYPKYALLKIRSPTTIHCIS